MTANIIVESQQKNHRIKGIRLITFSSKEVYYFSLYIFIKYGLNYWLLNMKDRLLD